MACPVSCDSCALGMCFTPATNEMAACDGNGQVMIIEHVPDGRAEEQLLVPTRVRVDSSR